jgi:PhoPQ-activated pathogenicity-related protein
MAVIQQWKIPALQKCTPYVQAQEVIKMRRQVVAVLMILFFVGFVSMVAGESKYVNAVVYEDCRAGAYIRYNIESGGKVIGQVTANGWMNLGKAIKEYEVANNLRINWSYRDIQAKGTYIKECKVGMFTFKSM